MSGAVGVAAFDADGTLVRATPGLALQCVQSLAIRLKAGFGRQRQKRKTVIEPCEGFCGVI